MKAIKARELSNKFNSEFKEIINAVKERTNEGFYYLDYHKRISNETKRSLRGLGYYVSGNQIKW